MLKKRLIKIAFAVGFLILLTRWFGWWGNGAKEKIKERQITPVRGQLTVTVTAAGEVKPQNRLEIKPPIAGRIDEILVREGDKVKRGNILAWMSSTDRVVLLDAVALQKQESTGGWSDIYKPTPLVAPIAGMVIVRDSEPGQTVTTGDVVLVLADRLIVKAMVDETDIGRVKVGQPATVRLDAYPDERVDAVVDHIAFESKVINNVTVYYVDILPGQVPPHFVSGMTADTDIQIAKRENALLIPMDAVEETGLAKKVWVKKKRKRKPILKTIQVGLNDGMNYEVLSGIEEETAVVIKRETLVSINSKRKKSFLSR